MSISLFETYLQICKLFSKINEYEDQLETCEDEKVEEIQKKIEELEEEMKKFRELIDSGQCVNDIPEYEDNREGCKYCSGCKYCQERIEFDMADEV